MIIGAFAGSPIIVSGTDVSVHSLNSSHAIDLSGVTLSIATSSVLNSTSILGTGELINDFGGSIQIFSSTIDANVTNSGTLLLYGSNYINGTLSTTGTSIIRLEGNDGYGHSYLTVANSFTNNGLLELTATGVYGYGASLYVTTGTLTNAAGGILQSLLSPDGNPRWMQAQVTNLGTINIEQSLSIENSSTTFTNTAGTVNVAAGSPDDLQWHTTELGSGRC